MIYAELFNYLANITTVIAFLFAGYQFSQWRKQQRHSLELESILNMEDRFELLVMSNMKIVADFQKAKEISNASVNKTHDEKSQINFWLKNQFSESVRTAQLYANECAEKYSLAYFRAERLGFDVKETNELQCKWIVDKFNSFIGNEISTEKIANEIYAIKTKARDRFAVFRKM